MTANTLLQAVYNDGERLVPGETHDRAEIVRHKSSYGFFRRIIEADILANPAMLVQPISILDIGSGTGHGTFMLSDILGVQITGVEPGCEAVQYAQQNYSASNIRYNNVDAETFVKSAPEFDYVVSRHALEHIDHGLELALQVVARKRLLVNVPFNEPDGNAHHKVHWITEAHFDGYSNKEFFYEGFDGVTRAECEDSNPPNSIICVSSTPDLPRISEILFFPIAEWQPEYLQNLGITAVDAGHIEREAAINQKEAQLTEKASILAAHEAGLNQREAQLTEKESILAAHEAGLNQREAQLTEKASIHAAHEAGLNQREAQLTEKESILAAHENELEKRALQLTDRLHNWLNKPRK